MLEFIVSRLLLGSYMIGSWKTASTFYSITKILFDTSILKEKLFMLHKTEIQNRYVLTEVFIYLQHGMLLNEEQLLAVASTQGDVHTRPLDLEIVNLKCQIQNNKQSISHHKLQTDKGIEEFRPLDVSYVLAVHPLLSLNNRIYNNNDNNNTDNNNNNN